MDLEATSFANLCDKIIYNWHLNGFLLENEEVTNERILESRVKLLKEILYAPKLHLAKHKLRKINILGKIFISKMEFNV